jgi:hypothetical protein
LLCTIVPMSRTPSISLHATHVCVGASRLLFVSCPCLPQKWMLIHYIARCRESVLHCTDQYALCSAYWLGHLDAASIKLEASARGGDANRGEWMHACRMLIRPQAITNVRTPKVGDGKSMILSCSDSVQCLMTLTPHRSHNGESRGACTTTTTTTSLHRSSHRGLMR